MTIRLEPAGAVQARLRVPGDKSISHRALILSAAADGRARIGNLSPGDDVAATADLLAALGVAIERDGNEAVVTGAGGPHAGAAAWRAREPLDARNSGTTVRLLLGLLAPRASGAVTLTGDASLLARPMARVIAPLRAMGAAIEERGAAGRLPLEVIGRPLTGRDHRLAVASAQVKSALLLAGLAAEGETSVEEPVRSRDHTERLLAAMGADLDSPGGGDPAAAAPRVRLTPGPLQAIDIDVPGDLSAAAPYLALAAGRDGGEMVVEDVGLNPTRAGFLGVLARMGAVVEAEIEQAEPEPRGGLRVRGASLAAVEIGPHEVPGMIDELPLVAVLATQAEGTTRVRGAAELRVKESDRVAAMVAGLRAMGARIEARDDGFEVEGPTPLAGAALDAAGDHRIAMALAVAALLARGESVMEGEEWVAISHPGFFAQLAAAVSAPAARIPGGA